jgi:hypothetical protein
MVELLPTRIAINLQQPLALAGAQDNTAVHGSASRVVALSTNYFGPSHFLFQEGLFRATARSSPGQSIDAKMLTFESRFVVVSVPVPPATVIQVVPKDEVEQASGWLTYLYPAIHRTSQSLAHG